MTTKTFVLILASIFFAETAMTSENLLPNPYQLIVAESPKDSRTPAVVETLPLIQKEVHSSQQPERRPELQHLRLSAKDLDSQIKKLYLEKPLEITALVGQTILFLITIASVDLTYQKIANSDQNKIPDFASFSEDTADIATQIINSGNVWSGMVGTSVAGSLIKYPLMTLSTLTTEPGFKNSFREVLQRATLTTAAFLGWEFGGQLWTEATYLLDNADEFNRAANLWGTGSGALSALLLSKSRNLSTARNKSDYLNKNSTADHARNLSEELKNQKDLDLSKKMLTNIFRVAFLNSELRNSWIDNTWRTRLMTGAFATYLNTMIATGLIGNRLYPGMGAVLGFTVAAAGAVVATLVIPQNIKDDITSGLAQTRGEFTLAGLKINALVLQDQVEKSQWTNLMSDREINHAVTHWSLEKKHFRPFREMLEQRHIYRSEYVTVLFESLYLELGHFLANPSSPAEMDLQTQISLQIPLQKLNDFMLTEIQWVEQLYLPLRFEPKMDADIQAQLANEYQRILFLKTFLAEFGELLKTEIKKYSLNGSAQFHSPTLKDLILFTELKAKRGFYEDKIITLNNNN